MDSPCYDKKTKTDCPRRCKGCAVNCPEWAAYVRERNKVYEQRAKIMYVNTSSLTNAHAHRINQALRHHGKGYWK